MFQNNTSSNTNKQSVNTPIETFFGELSYMQLSVWDDKVSFNWVPAVQGTDNGGHRSYDADNTKRTAFKHSKLETLLSMYKNLMKEKIEKGEDPGPDGLCVGVPVTSGRGDNRSTTGIFIEYVNEPDAGGLNVYFSMAANLTENGSDQVIRYKFDKQSALSGPAGIKGGFVEHQVAGEFFWFIELLKAHALIARYPEHQQKIIAALRQQFNNNGGGNGGQNNFSPNAMNAFQGSEMMSGSDFAVFS